MGYEWGRAKAKANERKHGVAFADAVAALEDELWYQHAKPREGSGSITRDRNEKGIRLQQR
jgi:uncharacterized DUF497 family protein